MDESSQNPAESIIIGNCLSCQGLVRVPATAPAKSRVRCPHCSESYLLYEILDRSIPELELVETPKVAVETPRVDQILIKTDKDREENKKFVVPPQLSKGARRSRHRHRSGESSETGVQRSGSSQREPGDRPASQRSDPFQRRAEHSDRSRSRHRPASRSARFRAERNPAVEAVKVIAGGLLAIPIAYLLVLWFFKQDPLNVGPKLGGVVPFLVPSEFRDNQIEKPKTLEFKKDRGEDATEENAVDSSIPNVDPDRKL
jgi:hypothetical protein